ncbi:ABC transporter ATP-binding protein [Cohnella thermotolerans]|uniref:ABC transporter ATP-binding protein n=1 Tax=Cohnella thermotolerans TaxID=329858 RepID=UPI0003F4C9C0|nr:ABC transporter ATP-binding protein [Cohnella thermotolerans]
MTPILEVEGLHKTFGSHAALQGPSFSVSAGEIISVLGPSGCGKSTLLQLIAGLQQPSAGEIRLRGEVVSSASRLVPPEKRGINMVFQDYALWPHMSLYDNVAYGLRRKKASAADIRAKVSELLRLLRLEGMEERLPAQLSGGQQQRVAIARALATEPDLLLLDEPLSNLDMRLRIEMRAEMAYLFRRLGTTVFHVTHDPEEAFAMADRLIIMRSGAIDQIDTPQACYERPATRSAASLLGTANRLRGEAVRKEPAPAIRHGDEVVRGVAPAGWGPTAAEKSAEALFRPDAARWETGTRGDGDGAAGGRQTYNDIGARVVHSSYEGSRWRVLAETEGGVKLALFHHEPLPAGTPGRLVVPVADTYVYPHTDER